MTNKRKVEVFSAGCPVCDEAISLVRGISCPACDVAVLDMHDAEVAKRAKQYGIQKVPAVVVDGKLVGCCTGGAVSEAELRAAGLGSSL